MEITYRAARAGMLRDSIRPAPTGGNSCWRFSGLSPATHLAAAIPDPKELHMHTDAPVEVSLVVLGVPLFLGRHGFGDGHHQRFNCKDCHSAVPNPCVGSLQHARYRLSDRLAEKRSEAFW